MSLVSLICVSALMPNGSAPKWFSKTVAGYAFENDESHGTIGVFDAQKGFYLYRGIECDGAIVFVGLTRDRKIVANEGYHVPSLGPARDGSQELKARSFPNLETDLHVKIDDTEDQVRDRLGKPTHTRTDGSRKQFHVLEYEWKTKEHDIKVTYTQTYTFKANHLIQIDFMRDASA